jgi:hypothetical protein
VEEQVRGLEISEAKRVRTLEAENAKLQRLLADAMLDNATLMDLLEKMVTPAAGREAVAHLGGGFAMSERRACRVIGGDRSSVRYQRRKRSVSSACRCTPIGAMIGGWRSKQKSVH